MLRRMSEALSRKLNGFLAGQIEKRSASLERELVAARKDPNVSLKDVKDVENALAEAREAIRKDNDAT
jgi:hypothetical protein